VGWGQNQSRSVLFLPTLGHLIRQGGILTLLVALYGVARPIRLLTLPRKIIAVLFIVLILFFGTWSVQSQHYTLLAYPLLFLLAGFGLQRLGIIHKALPALGAFVLLALSFPSSWRQLAVLSEPDTRLTALTWIRQQIPPGSRILRFAHTPEMTRRDPFRVKIDWENKRLNSKQFIQETQFLKNPFDTFDYLIYSSYDPEKDETTARLNRFGRLIHTVEGPSSNFPHHPVVYVYKVKQQS